MRTEWNKQWYWRGDESEEEVRAAMRPAHAHGAEQFALPDGMQITDRLEQDAHKYGLALLTGPGLLVTEQRSNSETKPSNPKDIMGIKKVGLSSLPFRVLWECGVGMTEGALKYGRHNYRATGIRASVYFDAAMRHLGSWWEGEDIDADSSLSHVTKAIVSLMVLRDGMIQDNWSDDRPIGEPYNLAPLHEKVGKLMEQYKDRAPHHYTRLDT